MSEPLLLVVEEEGPPDAPVVIVRGEADIASSGILKERLAPIEARALRRVVLDLSELAFLDCCAARVIADVARRLVEMGCSVEVQVAAPLAMLVLDVNGMPPSARTSRARMSSQGSRQERIVKGSCPITPESPWPEQAPG